MNRPVIKPVEQFFAAFGQGDLDGLLNTLHDEIVIELEGPTAVPLYRHYTGKEEARQFIESLGEAFQTQKFEVSTLIGADNTVMAAGAFDHLVKSTGKHFASPWALRCEIKDEKIARYQFYENTAAVVEAFQPT